MMKIRFDPLEIHTLASRYIEGNEKHRSLELEIEGFRNDNHNANFLTKEQLRKMAVWKSPRSAGRIESNTDDYIKEVSEFSLRTGDERARIEALTLLDGVGWPMASVILHLCHHDPYPILDFRALWSLSTEVPKSYDFAFWNGYTCVTRRLAEKANVNMRTLDRALWWYSKKNQPAMG